MSCLCLRRGCRLLRLSCGAAGLRTGVPFAGPVRIETRLCVPNFGMGWYLLESAVLKDLEFRLELLLQLMGAGLVLP